MRVYKRNPNLSNLINKAQVRSKRMLILKRFLAQQPRIWASGLEVLSEM
jgi:hypothetical protein